MIDKYYGLSINEERRKNLEKYEKLFNISIDTSLTENAFTKADVCRLPDRPFFGADEQNGEGDTTVVWDINKKTVTKNVHTSHSNGILGIQRYKDTNQIVKDWEGMLGGIGCTISFCNIYKDIVKNKYKYSLIFEDDIEWNEEFYGECSLKSFDHQLKKIDFQDNWDVFYLGTESVGFLKNQRHIDDNIYELQHGQITVPIKEKTYKSFDESVKSNPLHNHNNFGGQQAFILSYNGALQLLKYHDPAYVISDGLMSYAIMNGDIKNRSFIPTLFTQISYPRNPDFKNKLWTSLTGTNSWKTDEKYGGEHTANIKKGCSEWPLSKKYDREIPSIDNNIDTVVSMLSFLLDVKATKEKNPVPLPTIKKP